AQRPLRVLCLWRLGLYGRGPRALAGGAAAAGSLPEACGPPAAGTAPAPTSGGSSQQASAAFTGAAASCPSAARPGTALGGVPGRPAGQPRRGVSTPARHSPGASTAAARALCG